MNIRRRPLVVNGLLWLATLGSAVAQSPAKALREPVRVGRLRSSSRDSALSLFAAFKAEMLALGWKQGEHDVLVER